MTTTIFLNSSRSSTNNSDSTWVWLTLVPIGVTSVVSVCSNAIYCYNFFIAWNMISQMHRRDLELIKRSLEHDTCRRIEIEKAIDTKLFDKNKEGIMSSSCPICLSDFIPTDQVSISVKENCNHVFHKECLLLWLQKHPSCPCCRMELLPEKEPLSNLPASRSAFLWQY